MKINVFMLLISIAFSAQALDQLPEELFEQVVQHLVEPLTMHNAFSLFSLEQSNRSLSVQTAVTCKKLLIESNQTASQLLSYATKAHSARAIRLVLDSIKTVFKSKEVGIIIYTAIALPVDRDESKSYLIGDEQAGCKFLKTIGSIYPYAFYDAGHPLGGVKMLWDIVGMLECGNIFPEMDDDELFLRTVPTLHHLIEYPAIENGTIQPLPYVAIEMLLKHGANPCYKFRGLDAFDLIKKDVKRSIAEKEQLKELLLTYKRGPVIDTTNIMYPEKN